MQREVLDLIDGDGMKLEDLLVRLTKLNQLGVYTHCGFWQCMDTLREMELLNKMWQSGTAPWRIWDSSDQDGDSLRTDTADVSAAAVAAREPQATKT